MTDRDGHGVDVGRGALVNLARERAEHYRAKHRGWVLLVQLADALEAAEAEVERLRARTHEIAAEAERRFAPYVSRCAKFDAVKAWALERFPGWWTATSQADRIAVMALREERDALAASVEAVRRLCDEAKYGGPNGQVPIRSLRAVLPPQPPRDGTQQPRSRDGQTETHPGNGGTGETISGPRGQEATG